MTADFSLRHPERPMKMRALFRGQPFDKDREFCDTKSRHSGEGRNPGD
jgi:hypothetical protein